jgi:hypothetical protein
VDLLIIIAWAAAVFAAARIGHWAWRETGRAELAGEPERRRRGAATTRSGSVDRRSGDRS